MPRGRSKSRKNRKGNEEAQLPCSIECEEITPAAGKKKKDGPGSPGRAGGKVKHHQESGDTITPCESSACPPKEDASPKKSNTSGRESDNNSVVGDEKSSITPRKKKGRRKSQEINLNDSRERELQLLSEEILKEQVQGDSEKVQAQKQNKKNKNEALMEICGKLEDNKNEKNVNREPVETGNTREEFEQNKKICSNDITIIQIVNKIVKEDKTEREQIVDKDVSHAKLDHVVTNNLKEEKGNEESSLKAAVENWSVVSPKRQRKKQSKERAELPKTLSEPPNEKQEILLLGQTPEKDDQTISNSQENCQVDDTKMTPGEIELSLKKQNEELIQAKECERKLSVHEIKRKFCTETSKEHTTKTVSCEQVDDKVENTPTCKSSKETLNPGTECELLPPVTSTTTEIFIAQVGDKDSVSSSSLCRMESPTEIMSDDGTVKLKAKIVHGGLSSDLSKALLTIEKDGSVFARGSYETPKISVKQLRERLISSCSKLNEKMEDKVIIDPENKDDERSSSEEMVIDKHAKGHEKKDYNVSLKERLESYRCQANKEFQFTSTDQDILAGTSIKELQSSFDKMHQTNVNFRADDVKNKAKSVNDEIHHAQEYTMKCKSCGKQVFLMERVMAEKSIWHKKCFRCSQCRRQLTVENYKSHDGVLYCQLHYDQILKPKRAEGTVSAHNTTVEEVNISPINVKSLFEKTVSNPVEVPPTQAVAYMPVEKSPKFLKRLRRFETKITEQSEDDDERQRDGSVPKVQPDKTNKMKDDMESNFDTDFEDDDGVRSVKSNKDSGSSKKSTPSNSPRGKGKSLHGHLKQFFEKHDSEATAPPPPPITRREKKGTGKKTKNLLERLQGGDAPKKPVQGQTEDGNSTENQDKMSKVPVDENDTIKFRATNKENDICETKDVGQSRDVHSVISYFNQQQ